MFKYSSPKNPLFIFWWVAPLQYRLPILGECSRNPSVSVHQLALLWEAAFSFSEFFFENSFNLFAHYIMGGLWAYLPTPCWECSAVFDQTRMAPMPHPPYSCSHPQRLCFVSPRWKKSSKGNILAMWRSWNKKWLKPLKGIKTDKLKNCFEQWKTLNR